MSRTLSKPLDKSVHKEFLEQGAGIKRTYTMWSRKERAYLKKYAKTKSIKQLAKELGKTESSVTSQLYLMRKNHKKYSSLNIWTKEEDEFLVKNYGTLKNAEIGKKLGRTATAVQIRYSNLKCKGKLKEFSTAEQLQLTFNEPIKAPIKQVDVPIEPEKVEMKAPKTDSKEVSGKKESNIGQAFLIGLTILNTLILSWIAFSNIH